MLYTCQLVDELQLSKIFSENRELQDIWRSFLSSEWYKNAVLWVKSRYDKKDLEVRLKLCVHSAAKIFRLLLAAEPVLSVDRSQKEKVVVLTALLAAMEGAPPGWERVVGDESVVWDVSAAMECVHRDGRLPFIEAEIVRLALEMDRAEINRKYPVAGGGVVRSINLQKGQSKPVEIHFGCNDRLGLVQVEKLREKKVGGTRLEPYVAMRVFVNGRGWQV